MIAVVLTFVGYAPYIRDTIKGKTKPHVYTWFVWGLVTAIAYALQLRGGGRLWLSADTGSRYSMLLHIRLGLTNR